MYIAVTIPPLTKNTMPCDIQVKECGAFLEGLLGGHRGGLKLMYENKTMYGV